jgi:hypothetical protein
MNWYGSMVFAYTAEVTDDTERKKLNAIVGAAIKGLVESGADDEAIGSFAEAHRRKVASILGGGSIESSAPDLLELVTRSVRQVLREEGAVPRRTKRARTQRVYVQVAGKQTSLTIAAHVMEQLSGAHGMHARTVIQEIVDQAPEQISNRSAWVQERIVAALKLQEPGPIPSARH